MIRLGRSFLLLAVALSAEPAAASFVTFESGQVRPLALSPDGSQLFAANTPDDRLEIFSVGSDGLTHTGSVPVGLEPVAVAARTNGEVWVVNHLSDSVSIVDVASAPPHVMRTLLVGDEPRDMVFAGPKDGNNFFLRAFITTAHRGQNSGVPFSDLTTPGIGRADVWVFDASSLGAALGGTPLAVVNLFGDTPRALAVSPGGSTVYAAVFHSGNRTTTLTEGVVCDDASGAANNTVAGPCSVSSVSYPGGLPNPDTAGGTKGPETGLVVKFNPASGHNHWEDTLGRNWDNAVRFWLPDDDVFRIDATANPPAPLPSATGVKPGQPFAGVGTVLFDMAVNPLSGKVYVTNGEANNLTRFEGPGGGGSTVRGHLHEARITVLDPASGSVTPRHLNKHIVYSVVQDSPNPTSLASLATPLGMAVTSNGATLYVAAFGSGVVGIFDVTQLENDGFTPSQSAHIALTGGGPTGLVLDEAHGRLYVLTRFDNSVSVIDTAMRKEVTHLPLYNPEPASVKNGRPVLYDAVATSSNGEAACASCHVFADFDSLAWDLGNPNGIVLQNCNPFRVGPFGSAAFHPLKGPMTTQSLRGMANAGPMHWRGDRNGKTNQDTGACDTSGDPLAEDQAFKKFIVAFEGLLGRNGPISDTDMQKFTDFILQVTYPPNPNRLFKEDPTTHTTLTPDQQAGSDFFFNVTSDTVQTCNGCHHTDPTNGFFGTDGFSSFENETQHVKVPHLRNLYQKVGMFGMPAIPFINAGTNGTPGAFTTQPPQVRGFGFLHDGSIDTLFRFHNATVFNGGFNSESNPDQVRRQVEQFMLVFPTNLAPIVGQQITLDSGGAGGGRVDLLIQRATAGECDLVVKGVLSNVQRGWLLDKATGKFRSDRTGDAEVIDADLRRQAATAGQELTYTCVPPGSGVRIGIDRDEDGFPDRTEIERGSDPADPNSVPGGGSTTTTTFPQPPSCTSVPVSDPRAVVKVVTRRERGQLRAKMVIDLATYMNEDVLVTLSDSDTPLIAGQDVGVLPPQGSSGTKWRFFSTADGVQRVSLRSLGSRQPGKSKLSVKAKHWFTAAAANQPATSTQLTVQIGDLCFTHAATRKVD